MRPGNADCPSGTAENVFHYGPGNTLSVGADFYNDEATYEDPSTPRISEQADNLGVYAQARLDSLQPFHLSLGARYDRQWFEGVDGSDQDNNGASGNASVVFNVTDRLALHAGYSNIWGGIQLAENFILNPDWVYTEIEPLRSENYTAGLAVDADLFTLASGTTSTTRRSTSSRRRPSPSGSTRIASRTSTRSKRCSTSSIPTCLSISTERTLRPSGDGRSSTIPGETFAWSRTTAMRHVLLAGRISSCSGNIASATTESSRRSKTERW